MKTYINIENNNKVYVKGFRCLGVNGYVIYEFETLEMITMIDRKTLNKQYKKIA